MLKNFSLFIVTLILCGCSLDNNVHTQLVLVDSLLTREENDSALHLISKIIPEKTNEEDYAYYCLLRSQAVYKSYAQEVSDSLIDKAIVYYEHADNNKMLARALFYKGSILYSSGHKVEALDRFKNAEILAQKGNDEVLKHNIYFYIGTVNLNSGEHLLALDFFKKAKECAEQTGRKDHLVYDYEKMAVCYRLLGKVDSNGYYINKAVSMIESIPVNPPVNRARILAVLGNSFYSVDMNKSEYYLQKSISLFPDGNAYRTLAQIELSRGDTIAAKSYLKKSTTLSRQDDVKIANLLLLGQIEQKCGNLQLANELSRQAFLLKDSLANRLHEENVKAQQIEFDRKVEQKRAAQARQWLTGGVAAAVMVICLMAWYYFRRKKKNVLLLTEKEKLIEELREDRNDANEKLKATQDEMNAMRHDLEEHERKIRTFDRERKKREQWLGHGRTLLESLLNQGNMALWNHQDYEDFIGYYRITNSRFAKTIDEEYTDLSPNQSVLVILDDIGMSDDDVMRAMNLTNGALRTLRSRLRQRRLDGKTDS